LAVEKQFKISIFGLKYKQMNDFISIDYPEFLANSMRLNKTDFGKEIKISALVKLFELGRVSSGTAAKALKISRIEFLELLSTYKVEFIHDENLAEDVENA
jgi:predicted HTH domain antitoxin